MQAHKPAAFVAFVIMILLALVAWQAAFAVTGIGGASPAIERVPPPAPIKLPPVDTSWVDLDTYLRNHPFWRL